MPAEVKAVDKPSSSLSGKKGKDKKGKKAPRKTKPSKKWTLYEGGKRKNKFCPKCGAGVFMAKHKNRYTCGKCGYTEYIR